MPDGDLEPWERERGLVGPGGLPIRELRSLSVPRARRWIFKEGAIPGHLASGARSVTWVSPHEREQVFADLARFVDAHRGDCDQPGGFNLYQHGEGYAVLFEEPEDWHGPSPL